MSTESPGYRAAAGAGLQYERLPATDIGPGNSNANGDENGIDSGVDGIHPVPSLAEARSTSSPQTDDPPSDQHGKAPPAGTTSPGHVSGNDDYHGNSPEHRRESWSSSASPRLEKGAYSSTSSPAAQVTPPSAETAATRYGMDQFSPTNASSQGVFSVNDGSDMSQARRANRRRTGPLTPEQRERAAVMRKLGACKDCRRRRVAVSLISCVRISGFLSFALEGGALCIWEPSCTELMGSVLDDGFPFP